MGGKKSDISIGLKKYYELNKIRCWYFQIALYFLLLLYSFLTPCCLYCVSSAHFQVPASRGHQERPARLPNWVERLFQNGGSVFEVISFHKAIRFAAEEHGPQNTYKSTWIHCLRLYYSKITFPSKNVWKVFLRFILCILQLGIRCTRNATK